MAPGDKRSKGKAPRPSTGSSSGFKVSPGIGSGTDKSAEALAGATRTSESPSGYARSAVQSLAGSEKERGRSRSPTASTGSILVGTDRTTVSPERISRSESMDSPARKGKSTLSQAFDEIDIALAVEKGGSPGTEKVTKTSTKSDGKKKRASHLDLPSLNPTYEGRDIALTWAKRMELELKDARAQLTIAYQPSKRLQPYADWIKNNPMQRHLAAPTQRVSRDSDDKVYEPTQDLITQIGSGIYNNPNVLAYDAYVSEKMGHPEWIEAPSYPGWPGQGEEAGKPRKQRYEGALTLCRLAEDDAEFNIQLGPVRYPEWSAVILTEFCEIRADNLKQELRNRAKTMLRELKAIRPNATRTQALGRIYKQLQFKDRFAVSASTARWMLEEIEHGPWD